jgi:hypothetical protein
MAEDDRLSVECYSGARYGQRPTAFIWRGERHEIAAVLQEWRTPGGYYFRVITQAELRCDLLYDEDAAEWRIVWLDGPGRPDERA